MELCLLFPMRYPCMMHKHREKYVYFICMKDLINRRVYGKVQSSVGNPVANGLVKPLDKFWKTWLYMASWTCLSSAVNFVVELPLLALWDLKFIYIIYENSTNTSRRTYLFITEIERVRLVRKVVRFYSGHCTKHKKRLLWGGGDFEFCSEQIYALKY
jgi:hypothetical protein